MKKISKSFLVFALIAQFVLFTASVSHAQSTTGSLSLSPANGVVSTTTPTQFSVIYTGPDIAGAELHFDMGTNLEIDSLAAGPGLFEILNSPTTFEIHVGKLPDPITSGSTLAYINVKAVECTNGSFGFNQTDTLIPDVTLSFTGATYTCSNNPTGTPTGTTTGTPTKTGTLPKTAIGDDESFNTIIYATMFISCGFGVLYAFKYLINKENINS